VSNREDAEDLAQEAFVRIYRALPKFRGDCPIFTWMYRIALNIVRESYRKHRNHPVVLTNAEMLDTETLPVAESATTAGTVEEVVAARERQQAIYDALARIPDPFRITLVLFAIEGLGHQEIADIYQTNIGTVKSRLYRARAYFRQQLSAEDGNLDARRII
jgi:RNA polymerase sigma-70 factor (ECF subfamily)